MSWILPDDNSNLTVTARSKLLLLELCPDEEKPPHLQTPKSSTDPPRIASSFENRACHPNLYCQPPLVIPTFSIEYP
jgi:hypothetical protein